MYTKKRIKSLLGLLALGRPKYDSVQLYDYSKPKYENYGHNIMVCTRRLKLTAEPLASIN